MIEPPPGFGFPLMSPLAERAPHALPPDELVAEIEAELDYRRTVYGRQVNRNAMAPADALARIETIEAIRDDLRFVYDNATGTWPGLRVDWTTKVRELRRELAIRRGSWPRRVANPADPLDQPTAALRLERLDAVHYRYWMDLFASDDEFTGDRQARFDKLRAWHFVRWRWMRDVLNRGGRDARCVPPYIRQFIDAIRQQDAKALSIWHEYRDAAERHGLLTLAPAIATA